MSALQIAKLYGKLFESAQWNINPFGDKRMVYWMYKHPLRSTNKNEKERLQNAQRITQENMVYIRSLSRLWSYSSVGRSVGKF